MQTYTVVWNVSTSCLVRYTNGETFLDSQNRVSWCSDTCFVSSIILQCYGFQHKVKLKSNENKMQILKLITQVKNREKTLFWQNLTLRFYFQDSTHVRLKGALPHTHPYKRTSTGVETHLNIPKSFFHEVYQLISFG